MRNIVALCLMIALHSCAKEADDPLTTTNEVSGKLKKVSYFNDNKMGNSSAFEYDGSNRVVKINGESYDSTRGFRSATITTFFYQGSNELPYKNIRQRSNPTGLDSTLYLFDNQNRIIQRDYYQDGKHWSQEKFTYPSAMYVINDFWVAEVLSNDLKILRKDSLALDNNNNVIAQTNILKQPYSYTDKVNLTYDTKKNPVSRINIYKSPVFFSVDLGSGSNNVKESIQIFGPNINNEMTRNTFTFHYEYSSNDFPVKALLKQIFSRANDTTNTLITYEYYE